MNVSLLDIFPTTFSNSINIGNRNNIFYCNLDGKNNEYEYFINTMHPETPKDTNEVSVLDEERTIMLVDNENEASPNSPAFKGNIFLNDFGT